MKKALKITGIVLGALIILIIVLPFAFRGRIEKAVKDEVNKSLNAVVDWDGYSLSLFRNFPDFTFRLKGLSVVGVQEFEGDTLASIPSLSLSVNLMSVIKGSNYEIKSIELDDSYIQLKVLKGGKANWDIVKSEPKDSAAVEEIPAEPSNFKLSLKRIRIDNARIIYDDADIPFRMDLAGADLRLKGDMTESITTLYTKGSISSLTCDFDGVRYLSKANVDLKADLDADLDKFVFNFKDNELRVNALYLGFEGMFGMPDEGFDMDLKFSARKTEFKNFLSMIPAIFAKDFETIKTSGKLAFDGFAKGHYGETSMPAFGLNLSVDNAMFQYPDLPEAVKDINIRLNVNNATANADNTVINLSKFHCNIAGNVADMQLLVKTPVSDPQINGSFKGRIDLASISKVYPLEQAQQLNGLFTADVDIKGKMSSIEKEKYEEFEAKGSLVITNMLYKDSAFPQGVNIKEARLLFSPQHLDLANLDIKTGKNDFKANGKIYNYLAYVFRDELLKGEFNTSSNYFNLNDFLANDESPKTEQTQTEEPSSSLQTVEVPANIDFNLKSSFGKLIYDNLELNRVNGDILVRDQRVTLQNLSMETLGGAIKMNGFYDSKDLRKPIADFALSLANLDVQQSYKAFVTMQKLAPIAKYTQGKFSMDLKMNTLLSKTMSPELSSFNGSGKFMANTLGIKGSNTFGKIAEALKIERFKELTLQKVLFDFTIVNGLIEVKPFDVKVNDINTNISGTTGLDQRINYLMKFDIPSSAMGTQTNQVVGGLVSQANAKGAKFSVGERVNVDALVSGTVTDPKVSLGMKGMLDNTVNDLKQQAKQELDKAKEALTNKANEEIDKAKAEAERLKKEAEEKAKAELNSAKAKADAEAEALKKKAEAEAAAAKKKAEEEAKKKLQQELKNKLKR